MGVLTVMMKTILVFGISPASPSLRLAMIRAKFRFMISQRDRFFTN
jgi:hypothetical protein